MTPIKNTRWDRSRPDATDPLVEPEKKGDMAQADFAGTPKTPEQRALAQRQLVEILRKRQ